MRLLSRLQSWIRSSVQRADVERGMQDEMQTHIDLYEADLRQSGLSPAEARRRAHAAFGSIEARNESDPERHVSPAHICPTLSAGGVFERKARPHARIR